MTLRRPPLPHRKTLRPCLDPVECPRGPTERIRCELPTHTPPPYFCITKKKTRPRQPDTPRTAGLCSDFFSYRLRRNVLDFFPPPPFRWNCFSSSLCNTGICPPSLPPAIFEGLCILISHCGVYYCCLSVFHWRNHGECLTQKALLQTSHSGILNKADFFLRTHSFAWDVTRYFLSFARKKQNVPSKRQNSLPSKHLSFSTLLSHGRFEKRTQRRRCRAREREVVM